MAASTRSATKASGSCLTGAYSGVGAALLELLDELGAEHITVIDLKEPSGPASRFVQADLSSEAAVDAAIDAIDGPVHALFNNAGVAGTMPVNTVMAVNYLAVRQLTEGLRDRMAEGSADRDHRVDRRRPVGHEPRRDPGAARGRRLGRVAGVDRRASRPLHRRVLGVEGVHAGLHDDERAKAAQQRGLRINSVCPSPIETASAARLPGDDEREDHRLVPSSRAAASRSRATSRWCSRSSAATRRDSSTA